MKTVRAFLNGHCYSRRDEQHARGKYTKDYLYKDLLNVWRDGVMDYYTCGLSFEDAVAILFVYCGHHIEKGDAQKYTEVN